MLVIEESLISTIGHCMIAPVPVNVDEEALA